MWMLGALLISILLGAGVYALLISPELDKASTAREELQIAQEFNNLLDTQILAAQAEEKNVEGWYAEIAAIRLDLPPTPEQSALDRLVKDSLSTEGLPTVAITYSGASEVVPPASDLSVDPAAEAAAEAAADAPAEAGGGVDANAAPTASPAPGAEPAAPGDTPAPVPDSPQVTGLLEAPLTITTEGKPEPILRFLLDMQTQNTRFYTVTSFDITRSAQVDASPARPALEEGDWVINITGSVFNLFDPELSLPVTEPAPLPPYTGEPVRNVFAPLPGTV